MLTLKKNYTSKLASLSQVLQVCVWVAAPLWCHQNTRYTTLRANCCFISTSDSGFSQVFNVKKQKDFYLPWADLVTVTWIFEEHLYSLCCRSALYDVTMLHPEQVEEDNKASVLAGSCKQRAYTFSFEGESRKWNKDLGVAAAASLWL